MHNHDHSTIVDPELLQRLLQDVLENVGFYRGHYAGFEWESALAGFQSLPTIDKSHLPAIRATAVRRDELSHLFWSGGTSGISTPVEWYAADCAKWGVFAEEMFRREAPAGEPELVLNTLGNTMGPMVLVGMEVTRQLRAVNVTVPSSAPDVLPLIEQMFDREPVSGLIATPQGAWRVADCLMRGGRAPRLRFIATAGAPLPARLRDTLAKWSGATIYDMFGCTEAGGVGISCRSAPLFHVDPRSVILETVDHDKSGYGEVLVTSLIARRQPILRYRTGDIGRIETRPCECGLAWPRFEFLRRRSETLFLGGTKLSADQISAALAAIGSDANYQLVLSANAGVPALVLLVFGPVLPSRADFVSALVPFNPDLYRKIATGQVAFRIEPGERPAVGKGDKFARLVDLTIPPNSTSDRITGNYQCPLSHGAGLRRVVSRNWRSTMPRTNTRGIAGCSLRKPATATKTWSRSSSAKCSAARRPSSTG